MAEPNWRALCAELLETLENQWIGDRRAEPEIAIRARSALAQAAAPGRVELLPDGAQVIEPATRTILVPAPVPVAVSDRLPQPEDCDADGRCWYFQPKDLDDERWELIPRFAAPWHGNLEGWDPNWTHWLPFHALPLPSGELGE